MLLVIVDKLGPNPITHSLPMSILFDSINLIDTTNLHDSFNYELTFTTTNHGYLRGSS
jgi:hypothetical protein